MKTINSRFIARMLGGAAAAAIALGSSSAYAQAADEAETDDNTITVIGVTKQATNIQDVPSAITAFDGGQLTAQGVTEVEDVAKFTPGFTVREAGNNPTAFALAIRGQVQNDNIATLEPSVGVYLDDLYIARAYGMNTNLLDISSAQVLKGPQGTLFGRNTSAGAVLLQTNDAKFSSNSGEAGFTYGNLGYHSLTGILNVGGDNLALRGAIFYEKRKDHQTDVLTGKTYGGRRTLNGRVKLAFRPIDSLTLQVSGEWYDGVQNGPARQNQYFNLGGAGFDPAAAVRLLFNGDPDRVAVTQPSQVPGAPGQGIFNDMFTETYTFKATLETSFGQVKLINGYRRVKGENLIDLDGSNQTSGTHFTNGSQNLKQWSSELQLTGTSGDDKLSYAFGVTYLKESGFDQSRSSTNGSAVWSGFKGSIDNKSIGAYGQLNYKITDALSVTGGVRYSHDEKGVTVQSAAYVSNGTVPVACIPSSITADNNGDGSFTATDCNRYRSDTWKNVSYTLGFDYKVSDDILFYAKHSRGYRSGAQQLRSLTLLDTIPAQPEIVNEQEVGLKTQFWDKRVRFNLAGYHTKVSNAQRSVILAVGGTSQTILENANTSNWGMEADLSIELTDGFSVFAGASYTDPKYDSYNGFVVVGGVLTPFDKSGFAFTSIVKKQFSIGANYSGDVGFGRLGMNVNYAWQSDMTQVGDPLSLLTTASAAGGGGIATPALAQGILDAGKTPAHGITNARLSLAFGPEDNFEVAVWGRNVFDVRAKQYVLYLGGLNYVGSSWNDPATYGISLKAKF